MNLNFKDFDFSKLLPLTGDMTKEERRKFLIELAEAIARGTAEGIVRGGKDKS